MNNEHIKVVQERGIYYVATKSEQIQMSDELALKLLDKNQAEICGILRREPEVTPQKLAIIERWCAAIDR
jgi:hypothetical protein